MISGLCEDVCVREFLVASQSVSQSASSFSSLNPNASKLDYDTKSPKMRHANLSVISPVTGIERRRSDQP
jgi:hypothetical protein